MFVVCRNYLFYVIFIILPELSLLCRIYYFAGCIYSCACPIYRSHSSLLTHYCTLGTNGLTHSILQARFWLYLPYEEPPYNRLNTKYKIANWCSCDQCDYKSTFMGGPENTHWCSCVHWCTIILLLWGPEHTHWCSCEQCDYKSTFRRGLKYTLMQLWSVWL